MICIVTFLWTLCSHGDCILSVILHFHILRLPLKVEVWHRDQHSADVLIGVADVSLASVYGENKVVVEVS